MIISDNVTANNAHHKLALRENSNKEKRLHIIDQQLVLEFGKMRMRLNKYSTLY